MLGGASFSLCPGQITKYGQVKKCIQAHAIWEGENKMETLLLTWASLDRLIILSGFFSSLQILSGFFSSLFEDKSHVFKTVTLWYYF